MFLSIVKESSISAGIAYARESRRALSEVAAVPRT